MYIEIVEEETQRGSVYLSDRLPRNNGQGYGPLRQEFTAVELVAAALLGSPRLAIIIILKVLQPTAVAAP